ncbi:unnamed protein product [Didymodactylos carnosus]|uniref:MACPF domain-containing protein n=1 Tax=Didymodactylos carnosus TaxID=1234261 RepID=A0A8S2FPL6_9BILA|nr:unnamed protein product [Didymodactylos carnosus]CAF4301422.1 unnamed protein product [Didymodactylos carnosus]
MVTAFGTHYASSIIVGGVIEMYTQVNSKYQEERSCTSISQNTQLEIKFVPAVITTPSTKNFEWDIWLNKTALTPAVVNRTLTPITDLLFEYPLEIRQHLQLTIDYYLEHGIVPTLQQLSSTGRHKRRSNEDTDLIPGMNEEERKKRAAVVNPFLSGLRTARRDLCPIIDYNGRFCPGVDQPSPPTTTTTASPKLLSVNNDSNSTNSTSRVEGRFRRSSQILPLPRGVLHAKDKNQKKKKKKRNNQNTNHISNSFGFLYE